MVADRPESSTRSRSTRQLRIVVVDDEPDTVLTLLELLREQGYLADGYGSGAAALEAIGKLEPRRHHLGHRHASAIKGSRRPMMIAISGRYTKSADRILAQISGFNYYLTKPCDPQVLIALIEKAGT